MVVRTFVGLFLLLSLSSCRQEQKDDKAKEAVRDAVTSEFRTYQTAKDKLGEAEKQEAERRDQEKQLQ
jgi:hypothetical protein